MSPEKITNGSGRPCGYEMQGANSSSVQIHSVNFAFLKSNIWYTIHQLTIQMQLE